MRRPLLIAALLCCAGTVVAGPIYKWVDAQGIPHFSAEPPPDSKASTIPTAKQPPVPVPAANSPPAATPGASQQQIDARVREELAKKEKELAEYCTNMRTRLAQLRNNPRLRVEEKKGEMRRLSEEERQTKIAETEKAIAANCQ